MFENKLGGRSRKLNLHHISVTRAEVMIITLQNYLEISHPHKFYSTVQNQASGNSVQLRVSACELVCVTLGRVSCSCHVVFPCLEDVNFIKKWPRMCAWW